MWLAVTSGLSAAVSVYFASKHQTTQCESSVRPSVKPVSGPHAKQELVLRHVQCIFRHGARTPIHGLPGEDAATSVDWHHSMCAIDETARKVQITDFDSEPRPASTMDARQLAKLLPGGCPVGSLTQKGGSDAFVLGTKLRQRYMREMHFLSPDYHPETVFVRSTNITRTIESARHVVGGMFGTSGRPVRIYTTVDADETMYPNRRKCPRLGELFQQLGSKATMEERAKDSITKVAELFGVHTDDIHPVGLRDVLVARLAHNKTLPDFVDDTVLKQIDSSAVTLVHSLVKDPESLSLATGRFLDELLERMLVVDRETAVYRGRDPVDANAKKAKLHPDARMCLYSAHDTTLVPLLVAMGSFEHHWPPYASNIALELYEDKGNKGEMFVRARYNDRDLHIPGCLSNFCPLETFKEIVSRFIPSDFAAACLPQTVKRSTGNEKPEDDTTFGGSKKT